MRNDRPERPLARRVPGATNVGPAVPSIRPLPDSVVEKMRAAVDAAHAAQAAGPAQLPDADLILHQADEEPGHLPRPRRPRPGFPLLRLWR